MRCGWDLADLYRDRMTVRELWVRIQALPADAPLWAAEREATAEADRALAEAAEAERKTELDRALRRYRRGRTV